MRPSITATMVVLCLIIAGTSLAASTQTLSTGVSLWRGTSKLSDASGRVVDPATRALTALTLENCPPIRDRIIQQDALTRTTGTATYRCQVDLRAVVTFQPSSTCPPLPPPDGRVVECPTGYTGAYTQTLSYTAVPYPTCAIGGQWTPTQPPAGACVAVSTAQWTLCANEYEVCSFTGTRRVRYGLNTTWIERDLIASNGGVACRNATFGSDPVVGSAKRCELRAVTSDPQTTIPRACASRVCDVSWTPEGVADGFRIFYSRTDGVWANAPVQVAGSITQANVTMPETGIWYFAVKAFIGNSESALSNVVVRDVQ